MVWPDPLPVSNAPHLLPVSGKNVVSLWSCVPLTCDCITDWSNINVQLFNFYNAAPASDDPSLSPMEALSSSLICKLWNNGHCDAPSSVCHSAGPHCSVCSAAQEDLFPCYPFSNLYKSFLQRRLRFDEKLTLKSPAFESLYRGRP